MVKKLRFYSALPGERPFDKLKVTECTKYAHHRCHAELVEASLLLHTDAMHDYHVYILASQSRVLYIGVTSNLERRLFEHRQKLIPGFTRKYNVTQLVYFEQFGEIRDAIAREKQLKGWRREKKILLSEAVNPKWRNLSADWTGCR